MRKKLTIIIINMLLAAGSAAALELICINKYRLWINRRANLHFTFKEFLAREKMFYEALFNENYFYIWPLRKPEINTHDKDKTILLLGCSYTYGRFLEAGDTFSGALAAYTDYNIFNFGICGASPREMLFILRNYPEHKINPQYVVFTFITDQKPRLYGRIYDNISPVFTRVKKNGRETLKYSRIKSILENSSRINYYILRHFALRRDKREAFNLYCLYMKEINREIKKKFSDKTQMIILVYDDFDSDFDNSNPEVQNLKQEGIKIVKLSDITDIDVQSLEYRRSETDDHPNNKAWHVIAPALAEKLNLK